MKKILLALVVLCLGFMISCVPFSYDQCVKKMEKKDYVVKDSNLASAVIKLATGATIDKYVICTKTEEVDGKKVINTVQAILFTSSEDAENAALKVNDWGNTLGVDDEVKFSGKWVYFGTAQGIKDFEALL